MIWSRLARRLVRSLPRDDRDRLESELLGFFDQAEAAGRRVGGRDAASVVVFVIRRRFRSTLAWAPTVLAGVPFAAMCVVAVLAVYQVHFEPWRTLDHTDSTSATGALITGTAPYLLGPIVVLALVAGFRAVQLVRSGAYLLPVALVLASGWSVTQSRLFIERTGWLGEDLNVTHLETVSPYSIALLSIALTIPVLFLAADAVLSSSDGEAPGPLPRATLAPLGIATMVLTAGAMPIVSPVGLVMVLISDRWSARRRIAVALAVVVPVALLLLVED